VWTRESWAPKPCGLGLETRRLHTLAREKAVDRVAMNTEDAADAHRIEPAAVDQPPDGLGVHAQLIRYLANADEPGLSASRRQDPHKAFQVPRSRGEKSLVPGINATFCPDCFKSASSDPDSARLAPKGSSKSHSLPPTQSAQRPRAKRARVHSRSLRRRGALQATDSAPAAGHSR
jgi:hypothetical protein